MTLTPESQRLAKPIDDLDTAIDEVCDVVLARMKDRRQGWKVEHLESIASLASELRLIQVKLLTLP